MPETSLSRRAFLSGGTLAAIVALGPALDSCGTGGRSEEATSAIDAAESSTDADSTTSPAAGETALETPQRSGTLAYAVSFARGSLSPWGADAETAACINLPVLEGLYEIDPATMQPYPALAAKEPTETTTNVYEVALREYALFSDGSPVTAEDVVASFKLARAAAEGPFAELLSVIEQVEATAEDTVTVVAKVPLDDLLQQRLALIKVVPAATKKKELAGGVIGTGPWKLESIDDEHAVYVPNGYYTGEKVATADTMTCYFMLDAQTRRETLANGDVQAIEDAPIDDSALAKNSKVEIEGTAGFNPALLVFNTRREPFDDVRVRQAILHAIDAKKLTKQVFGGHAHVPTSFINEGNADYQEAAHVYSGDADKARELLESAGVSDLSFVLDTGEEPWMQPAAEQIAEDLAAAEIAVEVHSMPLDELYANYMDADEDTQIFAAALTSAGPGVLGDDINLIVRWFFSDSTWMKKRTGWYGGKTFNEFQEALTAAEAAEEDDRAEAWKAVLDLIAKHVPLYPILHCDKMTAYRAADLNGFLPMGVTGINMLDVSVAGEEED